MIIDEIRKMESALKVRILTCEAEIIFALFEEDLTSSDLAAISKNANTSFYLTLKRLLEIGLIEVTKDTKDMRVSLYKLNYDTRGRVSTSILQFLEKLYYQNENSSGGTNEGGYASCHEGLVATANKYNSQIAASALNGFNLNHSLNGKSVGIKLNISDRNFASK